MEASDVINLYKDLTKKGIQIWLDGGWGVDALLKRQTRAHKDVDIVVQNKDVQVLCDYLKSNGYAEIKQDDSSAWNFVLGDSQNHKVDVHVVIFDSKGNGIYGPAEKGVMYPAYSFTGKGEIDNYPVNCLTAGYQVESHTGYKIDENDVRDVLALCKEFNIDLPGVYKNK